MHINQRLPLNVELGAVWRARMQLEVVETDGGFEDVNRRWENFLRAFDVTYPIARRDSSMLAGVTAAFLATGAGEYSFDFRDWRDHTATDAALGLGDGTRTSWPLVKLYAFGTAEHVRRIYRPLAAGLAFKVDGVVTPAVTVDLDLGNVTFTVPPAPDAVLSWSGEFNVPVRFDQVLESEAVTTQLEHTQRFTLLEKRLRASDFA